MAGSTSRAVGVALLLAVGAGVAVRFAEPVLDGDLFFHLAYARQMLERGTLEPDATIYSWTPTSGAMIYCAWLGELALAAGNGVAGLPLLFALRYLVLATVAGLLLTFARASGLLGQRGSTTALTALVVAATLFGSYAGTLLKPELFSFLLLHLVLALWSSAGRAAGGPGEQTAVRRLTAAMPFLVLVWVNTHGAFVLLAPFLGLTLAGALLDRRSSPTLAFSSASLRRIAGSWGLCAVAVALTPYGLAYPRQLLADLALGATTRPDEAWNLAHQPILAAPAIAAAHLPYFTLLGVLVVALLVFLGGLGEPGARCPWPLLLVNVAYVPLFFAYNRATYWWVGIAGWSALDLLARVQPLAPTLRDAWGSPRARRLAATGVTALAAAATLGVTGRELVRAARTPSEGGWVGFGVGTISPVAEAEFLAARAVRAGDERNDVASSRQTPDGIERPASAIRLYNSFDAGSYLLWRLYPRYLVMTDSRSFPYLSWFAEQRAFTDGETFSEFLVRYPADLALVDHRKGRAQRRFLDAPDWQPIFFGPTGAVFVRRSAALAEELTRPPAHGGLEDLRNATSALRAADFALVVGEREVARRLVLSVRDRPALRAQVTREALARRLRALEA